MKRPKQKPEEKPEDPELGSRINEVSRAIGTRADAAVVAGITVQHLGQLITGKTGNPTTAMLKRLAMATDYSIDWIVTGRPPKLRGKGVLPHPESPNPRFMGRLVDAIARAYKTANVSLPPRELGEMAADEYSAMAHFVSNDDEQVAAAKLVRSKHERRLASETVVRRKRGA